MSKHLTASIQHIPTRRSRYNRYRATIMTEPSLNTETPAPPFPIPTRVSSLNWFATPSSKKRTSSITSSKAPIPPVRTSSTKRSKHTCHCCHDHDASTTTPLTPEPKHLSRVLEPIDEVTTIHPGTTKYPSTTFPARKPLPTLYTRPEDIYRASKQRLYNTLTPSEQSEQDAWSIRKADKFAPCPEKFRWKRFGDARFPGYRCKGRAHFMSDGILAKGVPGLYTCQGLHKDLEGYDRVPGADEKVPPGYFGPIRPCGMDKHGNYTYYQGDIDKKKTKGVEPAVRAALGWGV